MKVIVGVNVIVGVLVIDGVNVNDGVKVVVNVNVMVGVNVIVGVNVEVGNEFTNAPMVEVVPNPIWVIIKTNAVTPAITPWGASADHK